jgi:hypothetical protein
VRASVRLFLWFYFGNHLRFERQLFPNSRAVFGIHFNFVTVLSVAEAFVPPYALQIKERKSTAASACLACRRSCAFVHIKSARRRSALAVRLLP